MAIWQPSTANKAPVLGSTLSRGWGIGEDALSIAAAPSSQTWPSANRALYMPLYIDRLSQLLKLWIQVGATSAGNVDVGLYDSDGTLGLPGTRIVSSGSTAEGTASTIQEFDITDLWLPRKLYWLALACSSGTATVLGIQPNVTTYLGMWGVLQQATALPLPTTATPVAAAAAIVPAIGFALRTLVA